MLEQTSIHLLIPIRFDPTCFGKLGENYRTPSKKDMQALARKEVTDQKENFDYYFRPQPIRKTIALNGSPFTDRIDDLLVKRVVLTGPGRTQIGIYQNEGHACQLSINETNFTIGRIKIYFFSFGIGLIQVVLETEKKMEEEIIRLCSLMSCIQRGNRTEFTYEVPIAPGKTRNQTARLDRMLSRLLALQSYVPLEEYEGHTFHISYMLTYLTGSIPEEGRPLFYDTLRNQRSRTLPPAAEETSSHIYPAFEHMTWVTGDRSLICLGDLDKSDARNKRFLTAPDGMKMSVSENYVTTYAYCIARELLFRSRVENVGQVQKKEEGLRILRSLPAERFSTEAHINKLFDEYLWNRQWNLPRRIQEQEINCAIDWQFSFQEEWHTEKEYQHQQFNQINKDVSKIIKIGGENQRDLKFLIDFTQTELPSLIQDVQDLRKDFRKWDQGLDEDGSEQLIRAFIQKATETIEERTLINNTLIERETLNLQELLGGIWPLLKESTRDALISAAVLWESSQNIDSDTFDYSGICICTVSALEGEAGRIFFHGMNTYRKSRNTSRSKSKSKKSSTKKYFLMGDLVRMFGCSREYFDDHDFNVQRRDSNWAIKKRKEMRTYLSEITAEPFQADPLSAFMEPAEDSFLICFDRLRDDYRNKAAHSAVMTWKETDQCRELVLGKIENGQIVKKGLLAEMYEKIDFEKLRRLEAEG